MFRPPIRRCGRLGTIDSVRGAGDERGRKPAVPAVPSDERAGGEGASARLAWHVQPMGAKVDVNDAGAVAAALKPR